MLEDFDLKLDDLIPTQQEQDAISVDVKTAKKDPNYNDNIAPWLWNGKPITTIPDNHKSFVYLFTNKITGKQYIGFKTFVSKSVKSVKGKKKRFEKESDWQSYYSSSQDVLHDVAKYGRGNFVREIIALTVDKSVGKYYEAYCQFEREVLTKNNDRYYNGIVNLRLNHRSLGKWDKIEYASVIVGDRLRDDILKKLNHHEAD